MSGPNHSTSQGGWSPSGTQPSTRHAPLFDWDTNLADANDLPERDPEFRLTYLRRREENEHQQGIEQFLRFANQATPLDSTLNANNEYSPRSGLGQQVWPYLGPDLTFADATLAGPAEDGANYPSENIHGDRWPSETARELMESSWWGEGDHRMEDDDEEEDEEEDELSNEFEIGDWGEGDDEDEERIRQAMMNFARTTNNQTTTFEGDWPAGLLDGLTPPASAQDLADRNATAADRNLRTTYGLDHTDDHWATNYYDYLGSRPLNPPREFPADDQARPSVTRPSMFDLLEDRARTKRVASDPCSATSWTSWLAPGMVLSGTQVFMSTPANVLAISTRMNRSHAQSGTREDARSDHAFRLSALRSAYRPPVPLVSSDLYTPAAPSSGPSRPSVTSTTQYDPSDTATTVARLREFGRRTPAIDSLLAVLREDVRDDSRPERFSDFASRVNLDVAALAGAAMVDQPDKPERWQVEVTVLDYDPEARTLSGMMHALGFAGQAEPPTITTHLQGEILSPGTDGLWTPKSAKALPLTEWGIKRAAQAGRHWASIGPFKDVTKEELTAKAADLKWLRRKTEGWVLMRWKETGFVNVAPDDSALSIAGFYHCALDRRTGTIDGLYFDPVAMPYQTLTLAPKRSSQVPYAHETFAFR